MSKYRPWIMWLLSSIFYCYVYFLIVAPSVMMPYLSNLYHINFVALAWLSTFFFWSYTPMQLFAGSIVDLYGSRRCLTVSVLLCALGTYLFALQPYYGLAIFGRFLMGLGCAFSFVTVLKLANDWLPYRLFSILTGITTALGMLGAISGELLLHTVFDHHGYRIPLISTILFAFCLAAGCYFIVVDKKRSMRKTQLNLSLSGQCGVIYKNIVTIVSRRQIIINGIIGMCLFLPTNVFASLWGIQFFDKVYHFTVHDGTVLDSMIFLGWIVGGPLMGVFSNKIGRRKPLLVIGSTMLFVIFTLIILKAYTTLFALKALTFLVGFFSSAQILVFAVANDITENELSGTGVAITNMIVSISGLFQPIIPFAIGLTKHFVNPLQTAYTVIPFVALVSIIFSMLLKETYCIPHQANIQEQVS